MDHYREGIFGDEKGNLFSVKQVVDFIASNSKKYLVPEFDLNMISGMTDWWDERYLVDDHDELLQNLRRVTSCDTSFPILVLVEDEGNLSVADGLNRLFKALNIEQKSHLPAYLVPKSDIIHFNIREMPTETEEIVKLAKYLARYAAEDGITPRLLNTKNLKNAFGRMGMKPSRADLENYLTITRRSMAGRMLESKRFARSLERTVGITINSLF